MAGLLLALSACDSSDPVDRPNVLFILADDLRWDALGSYGNDGVRTPNLDRLAAEGAKLANFQVASPVCSPSRANLLTGLYTHDPGIVFFERETRFARPRIRAGTDTIATHLNLAGYATSFIGKAHLGGDPRRWGFAETPVYQPGFAFGEAPAKHKVLYVDGEKQPLPRETTSRVSSSHLSASTAGAKTKQANFHSATKNQ